MTSVTNVTTISRIALFGAGTMGSGIAVAAASAGFPVVVIDRDQQALDRSVTIVRSSLDLFVDEAILTSDEAEQAFARIQYASSGEQPAHSADLVIECIIEDRQAKEDLYRQLDAWCPPGTIIASNTSYLNIFELMPERRLPYTVIAHWFAPAHIVPLVEVVRGETSRDDVVDAVVAWLKTADRVPIVLEKFVDGFCINRLQRILGREIFYLLDNGIITAEMLDVAVKASIVPRSLVLGFVQRYDFTGLQLSYSNLQNADYEEPPLDNNPRSLTEHLERGELGVSSGKGFFDYGDEPLVDVLRRRDKRLLEVFQQTRELIYQRV